MSTPACLPRELSAPMIWSIEQVLTATGGVRESREELVFPTVGTDSRRVEPGALFFALHGEHHDGHGFVCEALSRGAAGAVVERPVPGADPRRLIRVPDTLRALGDLAAWTRRQCRVAVIAVTGSNGKTTTKDLIASICAAASFPPPWNGVLKTEGNFNNFVGLPLTVLQLTGREAVAVLEMGMNHHGEIARLTEIARPDFAVITNIGPAHLEGVGGTLAGVAAAKGELFAGLGGEAAIAVNMDDEWVRRLAGPFTGRKIGFGINAEVCARGVVDLGSDGVAFTLAVGAQTAKVRLRLVGVHNVMNALAAAAIGEAMGLSIATIAAGLERATGPAQRMQIVRLGNGVTIIDDAYNANPSSVEAALSALGRLPGRLVVVLGDMWELGAESRRAHRSVGGRAAALGVHRLIVIGAHAESVAAGAREGGMSAAAITVSASCAEAAEAVVAQWRPGDCILVKGSHGMRMAEIVRLLERAGNPP